MRREHDFILGRGKTKVKIGKKPRPPKKAITQKRVISGGRVL